MKRTWILWGFVMGVVVVVFMAFNYQGSENAVPLSEIFPEEETYPVDIEYEFVDSKDQVVEVKKVVKETTVERPVVAKVAKVEKIQPRVVAPAPVIRAQAKQPVKQEVIAARRKSGAFSIQVASFKNHEKAKKALNELQQIENSSYIASRDLGAKGTWYRVYVGDFETKGAAKQKLPKIQKKYKDSFIIAPKK